jgi:hypothetical protein
MTLHEDDTVRDALVALIPIDLEPPLDRIHARIEHRRRRARARLAVGSIALFALVVVTLSTLPGGSAHRSLDVTNRVHRTRHAGTTVVPTTKRSVPTTRPAVVVPPTTAHVVAPPLSSATTVPRVAPTTLPQLVFPPMTSVQVTPTTQKAPTPTTVPVAAYERITLILDDAGLHASAQYVTAKQVDIIFLDQRTSATSVPDTGVRVTTNDGQSGVILRPYQDPDCCAWFGAIGTVFHPLGIVTFQGVDTATNYSDIPNLHTTTKFVAS